MDFQEKNIRYFYCQSYQIFNLALTYNLNNNIVVISSATNIIKACNYLKINCITHRQWTLNDFLKRKNDIDEEIDRLRNCVGENEFHFSHAHIAIFCFYLVKRLNDHKQNTIFHNFEIAYSRPSFINRFNKHYLKPMFYCGLIRIYYRLPIEVSMSVANSFMLSLNLNYIKEKCFKQVKDAENYHDLTFSLFENHKFEFLEIENLFIAQFIHKDHMNINRVEELLSFLKDPKIVVKQHPKLGPINGLENAPFLPDFLPVELFFKKVNRNIISFYSTSLITASKFENCKTISLLDLVKNDDPFFEKVKLELKSKSNNKILFPASNEEFYSLLYNN